LDFQRHEKTEEHFLPDNRVIRSEQSLNESSRNAEGARAGVPGCAPTPPALTSCRTRPPACCRLVRKAGPHRELRDRKITSRILEPVGRITRVSVGGAGGRHLQDGNPEGGTPEREYVPRGSEEIQKIEALVKRAVNFDADRGDTVEVVNIPFEPSEWPNPTRPRAPAAGWPAGADHPLPQTGSHRPVLAADVYVLRQTLVRWLTEHSLGDVEIVKQLPKTVGQLEHELSGVKGLPSVDQARC